VQRADQVLQFTERSIAHDIRKVLASAVANASNPDNTGSYIADADELFVLACFADEGPTLRRFRPRARGRATRIRKRTCHITVIVARMSDDRLEIVRARIDGNTAGASANRRARVDRSRKRAEAAKAEVDAIEADEAIEDAAEDAEDATDEGSASDESDGGSSGSDADASPDPQDGSASDETEVPGFASADGAAEGSASDESDEASGQSEAETSGEHQASAFAPAEHAGGVLPDADGNGPDSHPIKGNADSMLYHTPDSRYYKVTKAEVWFDTEENAEAAGFAKPGTQANEESDEG
jgi:large subunit ribosomal protein L22